MRKFKIIVCLQHYAIRLCECVCVCVCLIQLLTNSKTCMNIRTGTMPWVHRSLLPLLIFYQPACEYHKWKTLQWTESVVWFWGHLNTDNVTSKEFR
jgi:hypothetical protein